jgi:hypothetical protein
VGATALPVSFVVHFRMGGYPFRPFFWADFLKIKMLIDPLQKLLVRLSRGLSILLAVHANN